MLASARNVKSVQFLNYAGFARIAKEKLDWGQTFPAGKVLEQGQGKPAESVWPPITERTLMPMPDIGGQPIASYRILGDISA
jgi:hypothetical protein